MTERLFGTDGIRGRAGEYPLDPPALFQLGKAIVAVLRESERHTPRLVFGRDTRESGPWIEQSVAAGAAERGAMVQSAGVITTPGLAYVCRRDKFDVGIVISASHNPFEDNGIKIFSPSGRKLSDDLELKIESHLSRGLTAFPPAFQVAANDEYRTHYADYLVNEVGAGLNLGGMRIVIDCANGAASQIAPAVFSRLGASVHAIFDAPDGKNINLECGSLHTERLAQTVVSSGARLGIAFDGDADRMLLVDEQGALRDGDYALFILARQMKRDGRLRGDRMVGTVMANLGLELALRQIGVELVRTAVGDRFVLEELLRSNNSLGGEQSGHIIFPDISLAGDGQITAIELLRIISSSRQELSTLCQPVVKCPQVLLNVKVARKPPFGSVPGIAAAAHRVESQLGDRGRLVLRYSGTENLARVMVEGVDGSQVNHLAADLAALIQQHLGV